MSETNLNIRNKKPNGNIFPDQQGNKYQKYSVFKQAAKNVMQVNKEKDDFAGVTEEKMNK